MDHPAELTLADILHLHSALPTAWRAATAAGSFLRDERPSGLIVESKSSPTDAVSAMDRSAETLILATLRTAFPADAVLGEEGGEREGSSGRRWVVDPLDGTVNYLFGIPLWGVSVALVGADGTELGVVCLPETDEAFIGVRGWGSWHIRRGTAQRLAGSSCSDLTLAMVTTGFSYSAERRQAQAHVLEAIIGEVRDVRRTGCAVVDFCWLAMGRVDAYYEYGLNPWDHAAGALICREAGMQVSGISSGVDPDPFFVAASPDIAADLERLLLAQGADRMP
ncbi:MAG TPA: inositol monophosphatase [Actinobacteria bacterium]|jgi:myo-inositol-1(or 4)-monophosphatase|nr:inositol monophosphatase [Actinomycetota bacterium]